MSELIYCICFAGFPPSTLFDWALPLLTEVDKPDFSSQFWSLIALREGLIKMDLEVIRRWSAALLGMCEQLLDAEDTPPHLLLPLLDIVVQVDVVVAYSTLGATLLHPKAFNAKLRLTYDKRNTRFRHFVPLIVT